MFPVSELKKIVVSVAFFSMVVAGVAALAGRLSATPRSQLDDVIRLEFVVVDDETALPVKGAAVRLLDPIGYESDDGEELVMFSDHRGKVALSRDFDLGKLVNDAKNGDRIKVVGWRVKVTAKGYDTSTTPLFEHTGEFIDERNPKVTRPNIRLRRNNDPKHDAGLERGTFLCRDIDMRISLGISGDRFDALLCCPKLCSKHTPWFEAKFGDVKRVDGVLQLIVRRQEQIRRRDGEEYKWLPNNLVTVKWGKRLYLIAKEQGIAFCNAVNQGGEPTGNFSGNFFLGEGHEEMPVTGLPEIPEEWSNYLLKSPVRGEVIELLPDSKGKVNVGRKQGLRVGMQLLATEVEYIRMEILDIDERESVVRIVQGIGANRETRLGDVVSTCRPRVTFPKNP